MKKIIIFLIIFSTQCIAQTPIFDIKAGNRKSKIVENCYFKDIDNNFNQFEGTWLYTNGTTSLKIILVKKTMTYSPNYYEDMIIGEYQYIENGIEKFNSLSDINTIYSSTSKHNIYGNWYKNDLPSPFTTVLPGETRLDLYFDDVNENIGGTIVMHRIMVGGQPAIEILKRSKQYNRTLGDTEINSQVPDNTYVLIKQP